MIQEVVRSSDNKLIIEIPDEYVGKELNVLVFSDNEVIKKQKDGETEKLVEEFRRITKNPVKPKIEYYPKMEDEVNDDIF